MEQEVRNGVCPAHTIHVAWGAQPKCLSTRDIACHQNEGKEPVGVAGERSECDP